MNTNDPNIANAMRKMAETKKTSFRWTRDLPCRQPYYTYSPQQKKWTPVAEEQDPSLIPASPFASVNTFTWNIDFMLPLSGRRMSAALAHIDTITQSTLFSTSPTVFFLQEMLESDLLAIQADRWIQQCFHITDLNSTCWESGYYGTTTLIDRRVPIKSVFRVHYTATQMERDALFVDVVMKDKNVLRLCNTHLESLALTPAVRPIQVNVAAKFMHEPGISASILAGDFNAIQPFDRTLHTDNNLKDAYLELGGEEDVDTGYTWGQQAQTNLRQMFGCSRMDKVFFCGGIEVLNLERFGIDVEVASDEDKAALMKEGLEKGWVTDHLGVKAEFKMVEVNGGKGGLL